MRHWPIPQLVCVLLLTVIGCGYVSEPPATYTFVLANDQLLAIESGGSYGTARGVVTSSDAGKTWQAFDTPADTCDLAGNGKSFFAITSDGGIWKRSVESNSWKPFGHGDGPTEYLYDALATRDGRLVVVSNQETTLYAADGSIGHRYPISESAASDDDMSGFVRAHFATDDEQLVIVEGNPFLVFIVDLVTQKMTSWMDGLRPPPEGEYGPAGVHRHGDRFLLRHFDGVYVADGVGQPWRPLVEANADLTLHSFCRDIISHDAARDQWLMADGQGVHLMEGDKKVRTVFKDVPDAHDLIRELTKHEHDYFISFVRLREGCVGVRLAGDLSAWEAVTLK